MAGEKRQIKIESILEGQSGLSHFASSDQFSVSNAINPGIAVDDSKLNTAAFFPSGLLRPTSASNFGFTIVGSPLWLLPWGSGVYLIYTTVGSLYSYNTQSLTLTGVGDLNDGGSAKANGLAYYDNYIYASRDTTVARFGPLNGSPAWTDDYWSGSLSKTALVNTTYPTDTLTNNVMYPNHILCRHSDGRLYIADVVGNTGTVHFIATSKTTVEGDTDNGSTYNKLQLGSYLYPTAMESYGQYLIIGLYDALAEGGQGKAKIAIWDTLSQNFNSIVWNEFADHFISSIKNVNGVLYVTSSKLGAFGFRVSRYIGGSTFEEVATIDDGVAPFPGAVASDSNGLLFGSYSRKPEQRGCVYSLGLGRPTLGSGLFNVLSVSQSGSTFASSLLNALIAPLYGDAGIPSRSTKLVGYTDGGTTNVGISREEYSGTSYDVQAQVWWSQKYRIGQPFKITKIHIPFAQAIAANMIVTPKIYFDDDVNSTSGGTALTAISSSNYSGKKDVVLRPEGLVGEHNFMLEFRWTGSVLCTVGLPITIEYELLDD